MDLEILQLNDIITHRQLNSPKLLHSELKNSINSYTNAVKKSFTTDV